MTDLLVAIALAYAVMGVGSVLAHTPATLHSYFQMKRVLVRDLGAFEPYSSGMNWALFFSFIGFGVLWPFTISTPAGHKLRDDEISIVKKPAPEQGVDVVIAISEDKSDRKS